VSARFFFPLPLSPCCGINLVLFLTLITFLVCFLNGVFTWNDEIFAVRFCAFGWNGALIFHVRGRIHAMSVYSQNTKYCSKSINSSPLVTCDMPDEILVLSSSDVTCDTNKISSKCCGFPLFSLLRAKIKNSI
jgi:hypothetical protein